MRKKPTGSVSKYRYYSQESTGKVQHAKDRNIQGTLLVRRLRSSILLVAIVAVLLYGLGVESKVAITVVNQSNSSATIRPVSEYQDFIASRLQSGFFPANKLSVDPVGLEREMLDAFPEIAEANFLIPLAGRQISLSISVSNAVLSYRLGGNRVLIAVDGRVIGQQTGSLNGAVTVVDTSNASLRLEKGTKVLSSDHVEQLLQFVEGLEGAGHKVNKLTLAASGFSVDIDLAGKPYVVRVLLDNRVEEQIKTYLAGEGQGFRGNQPKEYVDVRVAKKLYIK